jgi:hypothetical protein
MYKQIKRGRDKDPITYKTKLIGTSTKPGKEQV